MSDIAISIDRISKGYQIGEGGQFKYRALRDVLARGLEAPARLFKRRNGHQSGSSWIWALKDVSLDIKTGQVLGLIGRNGAGKTTLLKILTRITKPTSGHARVRGRVGSLLEVGTGFHPELSGRENIFLSGAILGMSKKEIQRKFDDIVEFAGVEKFIDTPAKHYSSGMYTRLAFSVAAHLEPEVLLVDEVLAVGDLEFQKKCLGKMKEVSEGGRTVVLVSHQMNQIRRLCHKVAWMDSGQVHRFGSASEIVGAYEAAVTSRGNGARSHQASSVKARFLHWEIVEPKADAPNLLGSMGPIKVKFVLEANRSLRIIHHGISLYNADGVLLWGTAVNMPHLESGRFEFVYQLPSLPLKPGPYRWQVSLFDENGMLDVWDCSPDLLVTTTPLGHAVDEWAGFLNLPTQFSVRDEAGLPIDLPVTMGSRTSI